MKHVFLKLTITSTNPFHVLLFVFVDIDALLYQFAFSQVGGSGAGCYSRVGSGSAILLTVGSGVCFKVRFIYPDNINGGPNITANLYCICLSEHKTCAYADEVDICGNI